MACVASYSFSVHLFSFRTLDKGMHPRGGSALGGRRRQTTSTPGMKLLVLKCSNRDEAYVVRRGNYRSLETSRSVLLHRDVSFSSSSSSTNNSRIIWGFWEGPDVEDGWGFVQAFVNHLT